MTLSPNHLEMLHDESGISDEVIQARDGPAGIRLAGQVQPVIILLDIQLPGMDGFQVLDELRRDRELDDIPVVALTSYAMAGDRERILAAGCNGYIEKPINPEVFIDQVELHLPSVSAKP